MEILAAKAGRWNPQAAPEEEKLGWTLSKVIARVTAILEDGMACAAMLARGVRPEQMTPPKLPVFTEGPVLPETEKVPEPATPAERELVALHRSR